MSFEVNSPPKRRRRRKRNLFNKKLKREKNLECFFTGPKLNQNELRDLYETFIVPMEDLLNESLVFKKPIEVSPKLKFFGFFSFVRLHNFLIATKDYVPTYINLKVYKLVISSAKSKNEIIKESAFEIQKDLLSIAEKDPRIFHTGSPVIDPTIMLTLAVMLLTRTYLLWHKKKGNF